MKKIIIIILTLFFLSLTSKMYSQNKDFEGVLKYELRLKNPNPELVSDSIWNEKFGNKISIHTYFYKKNKYKIRIDDKGIRLYNPEENNIYIYSLEDKTSLINTTSAEKAIDLANEIKIEDKFINILGIPCKAITLKGKFVETTFYYSEKFFLSWKHYKKHHLGNWSMYLKETNSLPLKIITKSNFVLMEMTAVDIQEMKLNDSVFIVEELK